MPIKDEAAALAPEAVGPRRTFVRADLLLGVRNSCLFATERQISRVLAIALEEISETLVNGDSVNFRAFGRFRVREKRERLGRNPKTGVPAPIKPRRVLTFKASPVLLRIAARTAQRRKNNIAFDQSIKRNDLSNMSNLGLVSASDPALTRLQCEVAWSSAPQSEVAPAALQAGHSIPGASQQNLPTDTPGWSL